jgi:hypothetical protein
MKTKTYPNILRVLLTAFVIIATGATNAQPTRPNPFDNIVNQVMYIDEAVGFEDFYSMFQVNFNNLVNYQPVLTPGCSIIEVYNVTNNHPINFYPTPEVYGGDSYTDPQTGLILMSNIWVYGPTANDGDLLKIRFRIANDIEYESPEFELYAPYIYNSDAPTDGPDIYWD